MEQGVKLRLGLALLLTQLVLYYYVPREGSKGERNSGAALGDFCRVTPAEKVCHEPLTALLDLCPLPKAHFTPRPPQSKEDQPNDNNEDDDKNDNDTTEKGGKRSKMWEKGKEQNREREKEEEREIDENQNDQLSTTDEKTAPNKEEKASSLIYQIIVVLLVVSVTASLADCFHERSRRKANPDSATYTNLRGEPTLSRRMSLADLTMQRHARRESQASFRPPGSRLDPEGFMGRRSSSQENPRTPSKQAPSKQKSCPAPFLRRLSTVDLQDLRDPQDGAWAERRRVRMIQRH